MIANPALQRIINVPSLMDLAIAGTAAAVLLLIALGLLATGKWRGLSAGLGALGLAMVVGVLVVVHTQSVRTKESEHITVTRPRFSEHAQILAGSALIGLPGVAAVAVFAAWVAGRRRLRSKVPSLVKAARAQYFQKEHDKALALYNRLIQIAPYYADAYLGRGCVHHGIGHTARALADFDQAIAHDPRLVPAYIERAKVRTETGDLDGALADFEQLLLIGAPDPDLYLNRGICLFKKGLFQDAAADFHRVLKLTNHSDYADPAKDFLRRLEAQRESPPTLPAPGANGSPGPAALSQPKDSLM